jgi:hypothetical protein
MSKPINNTPIANAPNNSGRHPRRGAGAGIGDGAGVGSGPGWFVKATVFGNSLAGMGERMSVASGSRSAKSFAPSSRQKESVSSS